MNSARRVSLWAPVAIGAAAFAAYANTFHAPFVFDDIASIVENPTIRQLWPLSGPLSPPGEWGFTVSGRPILNLSLAFNYALSGLEVWSYHVVNLAIHVCAGLALFGLVRRTLARPPLAARFGERSSLVAMVVAGIWTLHPLQTEAVTYVVQRAESLMGLFFLLTLYGFVRALDSPRPFLWRALAVFACLFGVGTKEVAVLAPVLVLLYDRTFGSGSFRAAWQRHGGLHLALFATWLPLVWLLLRTGGNRGGTAGFDVGISWSGYWLTQFEAITRYVGLAFWPYPLVFDYGKIPPPAVGAAMLWALPVLALVAGTVFALWRRPILGFLGAWFCGLLAPTSLVPGTLQMIVEHRMYLPLAAIVALVVAAAATRLSKTALAIVGACVALASGVCTAQRNHVYRDASALWADAVAKRPNNARAHNNLGLLLYQRDRIDDAIAHYRESLRLDPAVAQTHYNLGLALMKSGRLAEAAPEFSEALRILPYYFHASLNLGIVLTNLGRPAEAIEPLTTALRVESTRAETHFHLGVALAALARWPEAIEQYAQAVAINPRYAEAHLNWGVALFRTNAASAALEHFQIAVREKPDLADAHFNWGIVLAAQRQPAEAALHYAEAVRLQPSHFDAQLNLGIALAQTGKLSAGLEHLAQAAQLRPDSFEAHTNLALALLDADRTAEAIAHYEVALRLRPADARAHYNLGYALLTARRWTEAAAQFQAALKIQPDFTVAYEMLQNARRASPP